MSEDLEKFLECRDKLRQKMVAEARVRGLNELVDLRIKARKTIEDWWAARYENPVECLPHENGEFVPIWGSLVMPSILLPDIFGGIYSEELIEEVVLDLESDCVEWSPVPKYTDTSEFDDDFKKNWDEDKSSIIEACK